MEHGYRTDLSTHGFRMEIIETKGNIWGKMRMFLRPEMLADVVFTIILIRSTTFHTRWKSTTFDIIIAPPTNPFCMSSTLGSLVKDPNSLFTVIDSHKLFCTGQTNWGLHEFSTHVQTTEAKRHHVLMNNDYCWPPLMLSLMDFPGM